MAKTKIRVLRTCQYCNEEFIAHTTVTRYCSDNCAKRAYKKRKREEKVMETQVPAKQHVESLLKREKMRSLTDREFLTIKQAAELLGSTRMTIYRHTKAGSLRSLKFGGRVLINRSDINEMLGI